MKKKITIFIVLTIVLLMYIFTIQFIYGIGPDIDNESILEECIQNIYDVKCKGLVTGDWKELKQYYDTSKKYAQWSYEHEAKRIKYLADWSKKRGAKFINIKIRS